MIVTLLCLIVVVAANRATAATSSITLDGTARTLVYDGHGALSAGASSRLLVDYGEPQRSEILDYLFLPNFGANLHLIKVEIGGDVQSTDGTEASHIHSLNPPLSSCKQGYEFWLLQEAKKRNPEILTYALSWGVPGWVGNGTYYSTQGIEYHVEFMKCVRDNYGIMMDYMGIRNEKPWGTTTWVKQFRAAMDEAGFSGTRIVIPDGWLSSHLTGALKSDTAFRQAVDAVGLHYPCNHPAPEILEMGLKYWSSEDYSTVGDWAGAGCWGRLFNQNFLRMNMTSTISWSLIWSVFPGLPYFGNGLMYAFEPWSGYYTVNSPIWTSAQTCQFTAPGWVYLANDTAGTMKGTGSGYLPRGGSYVTLVPPTTGPSPTLGKNTVVEAGGGDFSLVIEKLEGDCLRCKGQNTTDETLEFQLLGGLGGYPDEATKATSLRLFCTNSTLPFFQFPDVEIKSDGSFSVHVSRDSICTLSTTVGAKHGTHPDPPKSEPFPYTFSTDFSDYNTISQQARYFTDQGGAFIVFIENDNAVLKQVSVEPPGSNQWCGNPFPCTMIGNEMWNGNVTSTVMVQLEKPTWPVYNSTLYAGVCNNVPTGQWIHGHAKATPEGVCVIVERAVDSDTGLMKVVVNSGGRGQLVQYQQRMSVPMAPAWISLSLNVMQQSFTATADQHMFHSTNCSDCTEYLTGYVALTSGWNMAVFDNFSIAAPPPPKPHKNSWVQTFDLGHAKRRNDFTGLAGALVHANEAVTVTALGRYYGYNNGLSEHAMSIVSAATNKTIASTTVSATAQSLDELGFAYSELATAVTLAAGQDYYLVSMEEGKGDYFFGSGPDNPTAATVPSVTLSISAYFFKGAWFTIDTNGTMYGPVNMLLGASSQGL